jgi:hypothetical protein
VFPGNKHLSGLKSGGIDAKFAFHGSSKQFSKVHELTLSGFAVTKRAVLRAKPKLPEL